MKTHQIRLLISLGAAALFAGAVAWRGTEIPTAPAATALPLDVVLPGMAPGTSNFQTATIVPMGPNQRLARTQDFDRERLLKEIGTTQDETVVRLTSRLFEATTPQEKGQTADALATHGGFEATANLMRLAGLQENEAERAIVLEALANLPDAESFHALASVLAATRSLQMLDAVMPHLNRAPDPELVETLTDLYRERNDTPSQKNQVLRAVAKLTDAKFLRPLEKLVKSAPEPALADAAALALEQMAGAGGGVQ